MKEWLLILLFTHPTHQVSQITLEVNSEKDCKRIGTIITYNMRESVKNSDKDWVKPILNCYKIN